MHTVGCVILTQNTRPNELARTVASVLDQREVSVDILVVGNGAKPERLPAEVRVQTLPENLGIPAGRNAGIGEVTGDILLFIDDDAHLDGADFLARAVTLFDADPALGIVQPQVLDPEGGATPRRFVPRLRVGDPSRSGEVVTVWEGACLVRRAAIAAAGAWPAEFFYMHEGIDLAWRVMDAGYAVHYRGDLCAFHPAVTPERHPEGRYYSSRNRVFLARRNLPVALAVPYVAARMLIDTARLRSWATAVQQVRGYVDGLREPCGERTPMRWRTAWRMLRLGRPPLL